MVVFGVGWAGGDLVTVRGVGVGRGGATVRSRVVGEVVVGAIVDELEFCPNVKPTHEIRTEKTTNNLFISSSSKESSNGTDGEILN
jgi:hypothetical protein